MNIDNRRLRQIYVPVIPSPNGVKNEFFYAVPGASKYVLSDYGRLYKRSDRGNYVKIRIKYRPELYDEAYLIQFDEKTTPEYISVRKLMARVFYPNLSGIYLYNPKFNPFSDARWNIYDLHVLRCREDLVEAFYAKIEHREPGYDDSFKTCIFTNRAGSLESFRKKITRTKFNIECRATNEKVKQLFPQYQDTTGDSALWESPDLFGQWYIENYYDYPGKLEIDKDILGYGESNRYELGLIALVPNYINKIFIKSKSELGYGIVEREKADGEKCYVISGSTFKFNGSAPKGVCCDTYIEALQTARKMKADYLRRIVTKERSDGYMPNHILEAIEKWANRCELGLIKIWEPSEDTLRKMGII